MADPNIYTVGWVCALEIELVAAASFLDEEHEDPEYLPVNDNNSYVLGRIDRHNVVIAALPNGQYGLVSAANVARDLVRSFPNVRIGLMVGIGGGAPSSKHDIRLGDVVVSCPSSDSDSGGVFQYDYGKAIQDASFVTTGHLNQPPPFMLTAASTLRALYRRRGHNIEKAIEDKLASNTRLRNEFRKPHFTTDRLYKSIYKHAGAKEEECTDLCDTSQLARRPKHSETRDNPTVHYGIIASANQLMKNANLRDKLSAENDILCFEMEAAGLMNQFPCLVIRGICDYSDTHKTKVWQGYAAMAAAAYAKDLLCKIAPNKVEAKRKLTQFLSDVQEEVHAISLALEKNASASRIADEDTHRLNVSSWLDPTDVSSNFYKAKDARHPGSGRRFIEKEAYQELKTRPNSFLWLYGIPGCGKTILTATIIEDLQETPHCAQSVFYFYFDFTDTRKQTFEACVRSLINQMFNSSATASIEVEAFYRAHGDNGKKQPSKRSLLEILARIIGISEMWLVLDALDECKVRDDLLLWLRGLQNNDLKVHVIATSRPEQDIELAMRQICHDEKQKIAIDGSLLGTDIKNYVHAIINEHDDFRIWQSLPDIQKEIEISLVDKANGMFRWVWCQLVALKKCRDPISLRKSLASLPKDLDETYARILSNVPLEYFDHTMRILQFLTYSERPLRIEEAVDAIAVNDGPDSVKGSRFKLQDRMPNPIDIVGYCSSLAIVIERHDGYSMQKELQLAHFSVKDYLTSDRLGSKLARYFEETIAQSSIAQVCLAYLLELRQDQPVKEVRKTFHLAEYSARYWANHALFGEHSSQQIFELAKDLFLDRSRVRSWYILCDPDWPTFSGTRVSGEAPALYYTSLLGLSRCSRMLLDEGADVNVQGGHWNNPLQAASVRGHREVVSLLLDRGATLNPRRNHWTPLSLAAGEGHKEVVRLLLERGAKVDGAGNSRWTPLTWATENGHEAVVRILLENGARVDYYKRGYNARPPLLMAAEKGYHNVMAVLLKHSADVNMIRGNGGTALRHALSLGQSQTVELLIKHGAVPNGPSGEEFLSIAAKTGDWKALKLLLAAGADHRVKDEFARSALMWATIHNQLRTVNVLLSEPDLDINTRDHWGATAISFAARFGFEEIFHNIAAIPNVDLDAEDHFGRTSLWWAQGLGHSGIASDIVEHLRRDTNEESMPSQMRNADWWPRRFATDSVTADNSCAVCLALLDDVPSYKCRKCDRGRLTICLDCYELGARCLVESHTVSRLP